MTQIKLGITGGIGSGKSVVSRILRNCGVPVYDCDSNSKRLTATDPDIRRQLTALVGADVYSADGGLNKPLLAAYLFASADHVRQVDGIIHPCVRRDIARWAASRPERLVGVESAIFYEAHFTDVVDKIVMVYAPPDVRLARVMARDHATAADVRQRMSRQMSDEDKLRRADFSVTNDGRQPLLPQVLQLVSKL